MKFKVYHSKNWSLNTLLHYNITGFHPHKDDYKLVAEVECNDFGQVFYLTNHIDYAWQENEGVTAYTDKARSTSVGDVVVDENGNVFLCASVGWEKVEWNENQKSDDDWWERNGKRYNDLVNSGIK